MDVHPNSAPTLLARSRGLPLSLFVDAASLSAEAHVKPQVDFTEQWLCKPVLRRTKQLVLDNVPAQHLQKWLGNLQYAMPLIETFKVTARGGERAALAYLPLNCLHVMRRRCEAF